MLASRRGGLPWVVGMWSEKPLLLWLPSGWVRRVSPWLVDSSVPSSVLLGFAWQAGQPGISIAAKWL